MATFNVQCPACQRAAQVADEHLGKQVSCPYCQSFMWVPSITPPPAFPDMLSPASTSEESQPSTSVSHPLGIDDQVMTVRWKGRKRQVRRLTDEEKSRRQLIRNLLFAGIGIVILLTTLLLMQLR